MNEEEALIDFESLLRNAEKEFLLDGKTECTFGVRRRSGVNDFYARIEHQLQNQVLFTVAEYRSVREGRVNISRPSLLRITREALFAQRPELIQLGKKIQSLRTEFAHLQVEAALSQHYGEIFTHLELARECFLVLAYLLENRASILGLLPRQIQHAYSTKLIGKEPLLLKIFSVWRGGPGTWEDFFRFFRLHQKPVEFRFYAPHCRHRMAELSGFHGIFSEEWILDYNFDGLTGTLIIENLETFHSEVARGADRLIIFGGGWKAALLRRVHQRFPRPLLYWGDLDKEGYEIFGYLRENIPDLKPTLMNSEILKKYSRLAVKKEPFYGPFRSVPGLQVEYQTVSQQGLCIEQEKIHEHPGECEG